MFTRLKYTSFGNALRPIWHAVRRPFVGQTAQSDPRRILWQNLQNMVVEDPVLKVPAFLGEYQIAVGSHLFLRLMADGEYETDLADLVRQHINPNKDALDIGANIGFFSCLMAKLLKGGRVLAAEPTPGAHRRLLANLSRNQVSEKVIVFNGAVSSATGQVEIAVIENKEEFSSIGSIHHPSVDKTMSQKINVPTSTLDQLVATHGLQPGFIKIDVEGAEGFVFAGAKETLRRHRPIILSELSDSLLKQKGFGAKTLVQELESLGYRVIDPMHPEIPAGSRPYGDILAIPN